MDSIYTGDAYYLNFEYFNEYNVLLSLKEINDQKKIKKKYGTHVEHRFFSNGI